MKPKIYPCHRYHKVHGSKLLKTEQDWIDLGGSGQGWVDSPAKVDDLPVKPEEPSGEADSNLPIDELDSKSDDEIKEMLMSQGSTKKQLRGLSRAELIGMLEGE